jgi:tetratricopeptide (TPR) repeat protein
MLQLVYFAVLCAQYQQFNQTRSYMPYTYHTLDKIPASMRSSLVFDFYDKKVEAHWNKRFDRESLLTSVVSYFNFSKVQDEIAYFKQQLELCKDNYEKSICYLIRGISAATINRDSKKAAIADFNNVISILDSDNPSHVLPLCMAYANRAAAYVDEKDFAKALDDYEILLSLLTTKLAESDKIFDRPNLRFHRNIALVKKYLAESKFEVALSLVMADPNGSLTGEGVIEMMLEQNFYQTLNLVFKGKDTNVFHAIRICLECNRTTFPEIKDYDNIRGAYLELIKYIYKNPLADKVINFSNLNDSFTLKYKDQMNDIVTALRAEGFTVQGYELESVSSTTLVTKSLSATVSNTSSTDKKVKIVELDDVAIDFEFPYLLPAVEQSATPSSIHAFKP